MPLRWVIIRDPAGGFETQALRCTDLHVRPAQIVAWFVHRWRLEVTFAEGRRHLGVQTPRQWSELAIRHTTPVLLGLLSSAIVKSPFSAIECPHGNDSESPHLELT